MCLLSPVSARTHQTPWNTAVSVDCAFSSVFNVKRVSSSHFFGIKISQKVLNNGNKDGPCCSGCVGSVRYARGMIHNVQPFHPGLVSSQFYTLDNMEDRGF